MAVWYALYTRKSPAWAGTKDYVTGIRPGLDPTNIQRVRDQAVPRVILSNVDVLTPTESSQGLLPDVGRKESIDIFYIYLEKFQPLRLDAPQQIEGKILVRYLKNTQKLWKTGEDFSMLATKNSLPAAIWSVG